MCHFKQRLEEQFISVTLKKKKEIYNIHVVISGKKDIVFYTLIKSVLRKQHLYVVVFGFFCSPADLFQDPNQKQSCSPLSENDLHRINFKDSSKPICTI